MKIVWHVVPVGDGKFRLNDQFGDEVAIVERRRDVYPPALDYIRRYYYRNDTDDIVFEGLGLIPFFPIRRWLRKTKEWLSRSIRRLVGW